MPEVTDVGHFVEDQFMKRRLRSPQPGLLRSLTNDDHSPVPDFSDDLIILSPEPSSSSSRGSGGGTPISRTVVFCCIALGILYLCWKTRKEHHEAEQGKLNQLTTKWEEIIQTFEAAQTQMVVQSNHIIKQVAVSSHQSEGETTMKDGRVDVENHGHGNRQIQPVQEDNKEQGGIVQDDLETGRLANSDYERDDDGHSDQLDEDDASYHTSNDKPFESEQQTAIVFDQGKVDGLSDESRASDMDHDMDEPGLTTPTSTFDQSEEIVFYASSEENTARTGESNVDMTESPRTNNCNIVWTDYTYDNHTYGERTDSSISTSAATEKRSVANDDGDVNPMKEESSADSGKSESIVFEDFDGGSLDEEDSTSDVDTTIHDDTDMAYRARLQTGECERTIDIRGPSQCMVDYDRTDDRNDEQSQVPLIVAAEQGERVQDRVSSDCPISDNRRCGKQGKPTVVDAGEERGSTANNTGRDLMASNSSQKSVNDANCRTVALESQIAACSSDQQRPEHWRKEAVEQEHKNGERTTVQRKPDPPAANCFEPITDQIGCTVILESCDTNFCRSPGYSNKRSIEEAEEDKEGGGSKTRADPPGALCSDGANGAYSSTMKYLPQGTDLDIESLPRCTAMGRHSRQRECPRQRLLSAPFDETRPLMAANGKDDAIGHGDAPTLVTFSSNQTQHNLLLIIPPKGGPSRKVSGECIICLEAYKPGEIVVWSSSQASACPHVFHRNCITNYFVRFEGTTCPCCRQDFI